MQIDTTTAQVNSGHLYGLSQQHLVQYQSVLLEKHTAKAFEKMQQQASLAGFDMQICSGFRNFDRQCAIWNAKAQGNRPLLNRQNQQLDFQSLSDTQLVDTILIWSALPGASRHHWGTDIDIFDANNIAKADLQLITTEYQHDGPCAGLHQWLAQHAASFGFYFPFQAGLSGVSPEPWHLSYFPVAKQYLTQFNTQDLQLVLFNSPVRLKAVLLARLTELVEQYVHFVAPLPKTD
ncbi:M15 family metallopeptidase [Shewanella maritima]|uniref:M15 family metallopeptidase n=1 Tax=Shewanella maritima TaxID=2520507 RepID=UPI003736F0C4